jgi:transposase
VEVDMAKSSKAEVQVFAGIDVSARELSVGVRRGTEERVAVATFANHAAGHKAFLAHLLRGNVRARVCLEASGNYSLDLALTLQAHPQVEISVVNPRRARRFAESLGERSKTDPVDARVLCEYVMRMPWVPWVPPNLAALRLRGLTRAIVDLVVMQTQEKNRQHSLMASRALPALVIRELQHHQRYLQLRITRLRREALRIIAREPELDRRFRLMLTTPGIGETSALQILGELAVLPDTLDARQWVAFSGLDPRRFKSGTSVEKKPRISRGGSRHLRRALYMPALVAIRHEPYLRGFYQRLLDRGKAPLQAVVAVMRKLLHAFFAMFQFHQPYDGSKLCPVVSAPDTVALCAA